jgi:CRP-like cAMP-binding protein
MVTALEDELIVGQQLRYFQKDETIYCKGDPARAWFEVAEGVARTCRFYADGQRQLTGFHFAGDPFGLERQVRAESAQAVTNLVCSRISRPDPTGGGAAILGLGYETALQRALENAHRSIAVFGRRTALERTSEFVLLMAEQQKVEFDVELPMSRTDIADYLGLTIHSLSRAMTHLGERNLISLQGFRRCRIIDRDGLTTLARGGRPATQLGSGRSCRPTNAASFGNSPFEF